MHICIHTHIQVSTVVTPKDCLTWILFRDNTATRTNITRSIATSRDFYATVLDKFKSPAFASNNTSNNGRSEPHTDGSIPLRELEFADRVYVGEDARVKDSPSTVCVAVASTVDAWWGDGDPASLVMLTYVQLGGKSSLHAFRSEYVRVCGYV
jgi:hypothetical protein